MFSLAKSGNHNSRLISELTKMQNWNCWNYLPKTGRVRLQALLGLGPWTECCVSGSQADTGLWAHPGWSPWIPSVERTGPKSRLAGLRHHCRKQTYRSGKRGKNSQKTSCFPGGQVVCLGWTEFWDPARDRNQMVSTHILRNELALSGPGHWHDSPHL